MPTDTLTRAGSLRGRDFELSQIADALDRTGQGYGTAVVIEGPSGSGKTRLLRELIALARMRQWAVLERCWWMTSDLLSFPAPVVIACAHGQAVGHHIGPMLRTGSAEAQILWAVTRKVGSAAADDVPGTTVIQLGPLVTQATHDMLADLFGATLSDELAELVAAAAGNPAAIVDLFEGLTEEGLVEVDAGAARLRRPALPRRLLARLGRQLAHLSPPP